MLIFINLILYIFICSLQSITKNVYGIEDPSNKIFRLEQLEPINNEDEQKLIIDRKKRHIGSGFGDGGGDGGGGCGCTPGQTGVSCGCGCCESPSMKRPRPRNYWRRPYVRKLYRRPHYIRRRPYCITKNVSGVENSSNNNLNQLEYIYDNYEQINRTKRYPGYGGPGDPGGDGAQPTCGDCAKGLCPFAQLKSCNCVPCPRPRSRNRWRRPQTNRRIYWRPQRPRHYKRTRTYCNRNKRYIGAGGYGDPGGDSGSGDGGGGAGGCQTCRKGFCSRYDRKCVQCPRPRPKYRWRRPYITKKFWRPPRPRNYSKRKPYWWLRRYLVIEY
uniref:Uncharacterized protein n=1 Tax=Meloidogyne floridensis TaxID=298350 RepID=A0A915NYD5_9BILA